MPPDQHGEPAAPSRTERLPGELFFALFMLMGSLVLLHQAWSIAGFASFSSAGIFPMLAAATMVISGAAVLRGTLRRPGQGPGTAAGRFLREVTGPKILFVGVAIVVYLLVLQPLGFVLASVLFLTVTICGLHRRNYLAMILLSVVSVAAIYVLFRIVFLIVLPKGVFL